MRASLGREGMMKDLGMPSLGREGMMKDLEPALPPTCSLPCTRSLCPLHLPARITLLSGIKPQLESRKSGGGAAFGAAHQRP